MKRRAFIKNTILGICGISISHLMFSCSKKGILLDKIIGKPETELTLFKKEGNKDFSYYKIPDFSFIHPFAAGKETFVFCKEKNVVGYTIKQEDTSNVKHIMSKLNNLYGSNKLVYEDDFGFKYQWLTKSRLHTLCYTKSQSNMPQNTFYSEAILNSGLIVF